MTAFSWTLVLALIKQPAHITLCKHTQIHVHWTVSRFNYVSFKCFKIKAKFFKDVIYRSDENSDSWPKTSINWIVQSRCAWRNQHHFLLPAALREAQTCRYLVYSEANFEVFRPAGATRCTDGGEIWHGGGHRRSPPPCQISPPSVQRQGCRTPKIEIFTQIWPKSGI